MIEKFFLKILAAAVLINCLAVSPVQAKIETVTGTGEYIMSMKETPEFAQQNAKLYAERAAIEQAGIFISSVSVMKNSTLPKDEITTFAAGLLKNINVIKIEMIPTTGNAAGYIKVVLIVEAQVDSDDFQTALKKWQNKDSNERSNLVEQNKAQQKLIGEQAKKIKELEQNLANIKNEQDKQKIGQKISEIDKNALYIQKVDEGWKFRNNQNYTEALKIFNEAVELNPNDYQGYYGRGTVYDDLKQYETALQDLNRAIELNPNVANAYYNRSVAHRYLKNYEQAISDCNKAVELNPNDANVFYNRGFTYHVFENYDKAVSDYSKVIELNPKHLNSYNNRGKCYQVLEQKNFAKAR